MAVDSAGRVTLVRSAPWLHPQDQAVEEMLAGWRNQQLSRNLQTATVDQRIRLVRQFLEKANEYPWRWTPALVEEYFADLKAVHPWRLRHVEEYFGSEGGTPAVARRCAPTKVR